MRYRTFLAAAMLPVAATAGAASLIAAINLEFGVRGSLIIAVAAFSAVIIVVGVLSILWVGDRSGSMRFWDVALSPIAMLAAYLLLFWLLVWLEHERALPPWTTLGATILAGSLLTGLSLGIAVTVNRRAHRPARRPSSSVSSWLTNLGPGFVFWLSLGYLAALVGLAIAYVTISDTALEDMTPLGGVLPVHVPWFGALGAVVVSLYGVFRHMDQWEPKWNPWHIARPLAGAVLGMIAFFILFGISQVTTEIPAATAAEQMPTSATIFYAVVAFIAGYREDSFRDLIRRTADVLLKPGGFEEGGSIDIEPSGFVRYGTVAPGQRSDVVDFRVTNRTGTALSIMPDGVDFVGDQREKWDWEAAEGEGRTWWDGSPIELEPGAALWIRTVWTPDVDAEPSEVHESSLSVAFATADQPAKKVRVSGIVAGEPAEEDEE